MKSISSNPQCAKGVQTYAISEAIWGAIVQHDHIAKVYCAFTLKKQVILLLELVEGKSLSAFIEDNFKTNSLPQRVQNIRCAFWQIISALGKQLLFIFG